MIGADGFGGALPTGAAPAEPGAHPHQRSADQLPLLWLDEHVCVVDKPSGLAVHQGWAQEKRTVVSVLRRQLGGSWSPVHRLDRGTSGALLLAKEPDTIRKLQAQFAESTVIKNYLAVVRGVAPQSGLIDHAIAKSKGHDKREARTAIRRLGAFERYSVVLAQPLTGRLHQIRRHLKFISHPLIGDTKYGKGEHNRIFRARFGLHRLALHASHLCFSHPYTAEHVQCAAPLPDDLGVIAQIGLLEVVQAVIAGPAWSPDPASLQLFTDLPAP